LYIIKLSNYRSIFSIENYVYQWLAKIIVNIYDVKTMTNIGVALFLTCMCGFVNFSEITFGFSIHKKLLIITALMLPILIYIYFNSYSFNELLFISVNETDNESAKLIRSTLIKGIVGYNYVLTTVYIIMPFVMLRRSYKKTNIIFKKTQIKVLASSLILIDSFFIGFFVFGPFNNLTINNVNLFDFQMQTPVYNQYVYTYMPVIVLILFDIVCYILIRYRLLDSVNFMKNRIIFKNSKLLLKDIRHIFHTYKNKIFSIVTLVEAIEEKYGSPEGMEILKEVKELSNDFMKQVSGFLNMFTEFIPNIDQVNIIDCLDTAIEKVLTTNRVKIDKLYCSPEAYVLADRNQLTEIFYNILINSVDAIGKNATTNGEIKVSVYSDIEWLCICIRDNGCGIAKKDIKNIFKPLYTTKRTYNNWGIGLSYVYKVVRAHLGIIFVNSEVGKYTEVQILLPSSKKLATFSEV